MAFTGTECYFASVKNILVKGLSGLSFKTREFFGIQALIFGVGSIVLLSVSLFNFSGISLFTLLLSLAGTMDSAIFFPAINIGSIVISMIFGMIIYKEKLNIRDIAVLCLGAVAIALVNL